MAEKVYVLDEVTVIPGAAIAYRDAYLSNYAPGARERGMTLEYARMTPPFVWLEGENVLHFMWSLTDVAAWWSMRIGGVDGRPLDTAGLDRADWWQTTEHLVVSRRRSVLTDFGSGEVS